MYSMININCKLMFFGKPLHLLQVFSTEVIGIKIDKKMLCSSISFQPQNRNVKIKKILDSVLKSDLSSFLDEKQLPLLTSLFKSCKNYRIFYKFVLNYDVAKDIVDKILPHISKDKDIVVEANPGLGFITLCLINSNVPRVTILDKSEIVSIIVKQMIEHHKGRFRLIEVNLFKCPGLQITNLIEDSTKLNLSTKVIGVICNNTFFINLMFTYIANELWECMHYLEFYLVVNSTVWNTIMTYTSSDSRYYYYYLFNFLFQFEVLGKYPRDAFFPIGSNDKGSMTLVRIRANSDLIESINKNELKNFIFFLDILTRNKKTLIIPTLEKFAPNCGPYLISKGISMTNIISDLSVSDSVYLFKLFMKYQGYNIFRTFNFTGQGNLGMNWSYCNRMMFHSQKQKKPHENLAVRLVFEL